jgi:hypothetical protein
MCRLVIEINTFIAMDSQDWTPVVIKRRFTKSEMLQRGMMTSELKDSEKAEKQRLAKLESQEAPTIKKKVQPESIQELIRKRIELKLTQEKADMSCSFPKHTFRDIEAYRLVPNESQKRKIQQVLGINLKIDTIQLNTENK